MPQVQFERWRELSETDAPKAFEAEIRSLEKVVLSTDPILLLSALSAYQFHDPGINPEYKFSDPLLQFHLEWLQGYCLRFELDECARPEYLNPVLSETTERLKRIPIISVLDRWQRVKGEPGDDNPVVGTWEQELARIERLAVRNWGYADQMISLVGKLSERVDTWAESVIGYRLSPLPPLLMKTVVEVERRFNAQRREARSIVQHTKSPIGFCRRWQRSTLPGAERASGLEAGLRAGTLAPEDILPDFVRSFETAFPSFFTFSPEEVATLSEGAYSAVQCENILEAFSLQFGSLKKSPVEHLTLGNPVWTRPFIKLDSDAYFCPVPGMLLSHCMELVEPIVLQREEERWWAARSGFLESRAHDILSQAFPTAVKHLNSKWTDPNDSSMVYENDIALFVGDVALVVEAKAHRVPAAVRRGAPEGMRESIEEMVIHPSSQSLRFCQYLLGDRGERPFFNKDEGEFTVDSSYLRLVVRLNAVLDSFALSTVSTKSLRTAGLLRKQEPNPAPTLLLSDLESILFLLPDEIQRLHYLARRAILQDKLDYQADEMDFLALYIEEGFTREDLEVEGEKLLFRGISTSIDPFLERHYAGKRAGSAPRRQLHPLWSNAMHLLKQKTPPNWVSIGMVLLDASAQQQQEFFVTAKIRAEQLKRSDGDKSVDGWAVEVGNTLWKALIIGIVVGSGDEDDRDVLIEAEVEKLHAPTSLDAAIIVFSPSVGTKRPISCGMLLGEKVEISATNDLLTDSLLQSAHDLVT